MTAQADTPGAHPYYLHALSDLRDARALLTAGDEQNVEQNEGAAIIEIDQALGGLRRAAIDDGKPVNYHPPVDANLSHRDRLNRALTLIGKAHQDITRPEADPAALGWRRDAVTHVDRAYGDTKQAIRADYGDDHPFVPGSHPHFLHAISDLRAARALLNAPDEKGNVVSDERIATRAITRPSAPPNRVPWMTAGHLLQPARRNESAATRPTCPSSEVNQRRSLRGDALPGN